jgi:5-methylcytosine-specific restriction endonuclease McrA
VERAVDLLLDKTVKRRPHAIKRSRRPNSRYIPRAVMREVHQRDGGQCTFVSLECKRCCERDFLEFHHHVPYGRGGEATADNLRLACRVFNALFAERDFGPGYMRSKLLHARAQAASGSGAGELCPERLQV